MKILCVNTSVLLAPRKLLISLPVFFLLQFSSLYNNAKAGVIFSQVYATNGNVGTTYNATFIQLYNLSAAPININGWFIQLRGTTGSYTVIDLPNTTIPAYQPFMNLS